MPTDPLIKFPNVIVTPHLGGSPRWNSLDDIEEVIVSLGRLLAEQSLGSRNPYG